MSVTLDIGPVPNYPNEPAMPVIIRMRVLGITIENGYPKEQCVSIAHSVGAYAGRQWRREHDGEGPHERLTRKTFGHGFHYKAWYPMHWWGLIDGQIRYMERAD